MIRLSIGCCGPRQARHGPVSQPLTRPTILAHDPRSRWPGGRPMPTHSDTNPASAAAILDAAIRARKATRALRPDPVPRHLLTEILEAARAAPSNYNSQPWRVHVLTGEAK